MTDDNRTLCGLRKEMYSAQVFIWVYIMLVLGELCRQHEDRWTLWVLLAGSLFMVIGYSLGTYRQKREVLADRAGKESAAPPEVGAG